MSRRASQAGIDAIRHAMKRNGWTQTEAAKEAGFSRSTLNQILGGQPVKLENLEELCHLLELQVGQVVEPEDLTESAALDALVQTLRNSIQPLIQQRCGTMRVLDMTQPIGLDQIYTHVNILEKITGRSRREPAEILQAVLPGGSPEDFERFSLGRVREERLPGLEAVEKHPKLMILGKPGAGKTTFLKHLAIQCSGGGFQAHRVPVFVTLKDFAEADGTPDLVTFIAQWVNPDSRLNPVPTALQQILSNGRALILLDGLDEVRETDAARVLRQIQQFSERYADNAFVITCRIAAREYTFAQFTEVEVADFDDAQIADVSGKWFRCKQDAVKAERFLQKLKENPPIRDLASSPLLLTLLSLVFEDAGDFPANRAELYQNGVDVLLKKWDAKRNIERHQFYKKLSLKRKEDLLSQIAYRTFATGNYFFKQKEVERQIRDFIENLSGASTDEEVLNLDSEAVLKSIEAQHGLFVERARGIYSFSHSTFHEYFAAREIKEKSHFAELCQRVADKRWREVTLLTMGMVPNADALLRLMKQQIDGLVAGGEKLQRFLAWVDEKARLVNPYHKPDARRKSAAIRAFYFALDLFLNRPLDHARAFAFDLNLNFPHSLDRTLPPDINIDWDFARALARTREIDFTTDPALNLALFRALVLDLDNIWRSNSELQQQIEDLRGQLPLFSASWQIKEQWWRANGEAWGEQLYSVMIEHRNFGHDWQFSESQKQQLQQYHTANQLLVACLNSDCYVSRSVRQEIEDTLYCYPSRA
jgi:predicted NACHT family NTPase